MKTNTTNAPTTMMALLLLCPTTLPAGTLNYQYDRLDRLTQVAYPDGTIIEYRYDPAGNRTRKSVYLSTDSDSDSDKDGIPDATDNCPTIANADQANHDSDALGDACDPDDDNDGVPDLLDAFPLDADEWIDTDGDRIGDNADPDDDNDGIGDTEDPYPLDPALPGSSDVISVKPGLNVIAYLSTVSAEHATCYGLFAGLGGTAAIDSLARFNSVSQTFESCDAQGGIDFPIVAGEAYIVKGISKNDTRLGGEPACPDLTLKVGLNLRGYLQPPPDSTCYQWLEAIGPGAISAIQRFDHRVGRFQGCAYMDMNGIPVPTGKNFPIVPGEGYLLFSPMGIILPRECGEQ